MNDNSTLNAKAGKKYITESGWITPTLLDDGDYVKTETGSRWFRDGKWWHMAGEEPHAGNLIAEYHEPDPDVKIIEERDAAESALGEAFQIVTGREAVWSNMFGPDDALEEMHEAVAKPAPAGWITDRIPTRADAVPTDIFPDGAVAVPQNEGSQHWVFAAWDNPRFTAHNSAIRYKAWHRIIPKFTPPPPEKKKAPLGPEDVGPGQMIKHPSGKVRIILDNNHSVVMYANLEVTGGWAAITYADLESAGFEISRDGGKTWENYYREMEVEA